MDGGKPVAKLMRDPGGEFAETRERLLEPQLLVQFRDVGQVGEQADDAVAVLDCAKRRHRHAVMRGPLGAQYLYRSPDDRGLGCEALREDVNQRRSAGK